MCGRFTLSQSDQSIADVFQLSEIPPVKPRYNISPTQAVPVVFQTTNSPARKFTYMHWGLIPSWADDPKIGARMINARAETVTEKPSFRTAFKRRRCLVVADGFYEWKKTDEGKQPFYIQLDHHQPFGFAGLWEHWQHADGSEIESCTIVTTEPNELLRPIHNRMPVILNPDDYDRWLNPEVQDAKSLQPLLRPYDAQQMIHYPVSMVVNNPQNDSPECIRAIA
ncbi:MAG: SOS response-associated peptidase [Elainellaceae cyanobacterium]